MINLSTKIMRVLTDEIKCKSLQFSTPSEEVYPISVAYISDLENFCPLSSSPMLEF